MTKFKLQVNSAGAWKDVVTGTKEQIQDLEHHVSVIAEIAGKGYKWRIIEAALGDVIGYCSAPDFIWTPRT